jgi:signal peptidase
VYKSFISRQPRINEDKGINMHRLSLRFTVIVCVAIVLMQTIYLFIPVTVISLYDAVLRPVVYLALAVAIMVFLGRDLRPVPKAFSTNLIAFISIMVFLITTLVISIVYGLGTNTLAANPTLVIHNLWERGLIIVAGEFIRYKLIKNARPLNRTTVAVVLTMVLAYGHMDGLRLMMAGDIVFIAVFYESIFRPLVISIVASYFAFKGTFLSTFTLSFFYTMLPFLAPVVPNITPFAFSLVSSALAFATVILHHFATYSKSKRQRKREKMILKYARKPVLFNTITAIVVTLIIAFFVGMFPVYPIVVLTGSMEDTVSRGSVVFVERVQPGEAFDMVGEGYIIHFMSRGRVEYIHRVVDFRLDADGERKFITQGDASYLVDPHPVPQEDVLGVARAHIPFLGYPYIAFWSVVRGF